MQRRLVGLGVSWVVSLSGCGGGDPAPGSKIGSTDSHMGGGGAAGSLSLGTDGGGGSGGSGGGGSGGGGSGGASGAGGTSSANAGSSTGGTTAQAGSGTSGGNSSGGSGSEPAGSCARQTVSDADCADFFEDKPKAYDCSTIGAASTLNQSQGAQCASVSFVAGAGVGECCPM